MQHSPIALCLPFGRLCTCGLLLQLSACGPDAGKGVAPADPTGTSTEAPGTDTPEGPTTPPSTSGLTGLCVPDALWSESTLGMPHAGPQKLLVLLGHNADGPVSVTLEEVDDLVGELEGWFDAVSRGRTWFDTEVVGWYDVPEATLTDASVLYTAAADDGVDLTGYDRLLVVVTEQQPGEGEGIGAPPYTFQVSSAGGVQTVTAAVAKVYWTGDAVRAREVAIHEVAHGFGLSHAFSVSGLSGAEINYGMTYDTMGAAGEGSLNVAYQRQIGWLDAEEIEVVAAPGTYTLEALHQVEGVKALGLFRPSASGACEEAVLIETRRAVGVDAELRYNTLDSLLLADVTPNGDRLRAAALDATPETPFDNVLDGGLTDGRSLALYDLGLVVTTLAVGETSTEVAVAPLALEGNAPPEIAAVSGEVVGDGPYTVTLTVDASDPDGDPLSFFWDLGLLDGARDSAYAAGTYGSGEVVEHSYADAQPRRAFVAVSDRRGHTTWGAVDLFGYQNEAPSVSPVEISGYFGGYTFQIEADDEEPLLLTWHFGDGHRSHVVSPQHIYEEPGTYEVVVTVSDRDATVVVSTELEAAPLDDNLAPVADAGEDFEVAPGEVFAVDGSGSDDPDAYPLALSLTWSGPPESEPVTDVHREVVEYVAPLVPGDYSYSLQVSDGDRSDVDVVVVSVVE